MRRQLVAAAMVIVVAGAPGLHAAGAADVDRAADGGGAACTSGTSWSTTALFDDGVGTVTGADYQRALPLEDGRTLWVFQDAFVSSPSGPVLVHNAAAIETDGCLEPLVGGTPDSPRSWIAADTTVHMQHWYWPLAGTQIDDDTYRLYVAEFREHGDHYLAEATPEATLTVDIDLTDMTPAAPTPAVDSSADLYGWSIVEDGEYRYLYGYCYRQFGASMIGHHPCSAEVRVARQPVVDADAPLDYWDGDGWSPRAAAAVNVAPSTGPFGEARTINPMQVSRAGDGSFMAVTKEGDWWGDSLYLDVAPAPQGPWTTTAVIPVRTLGGPETTNTYFASFVPTADWGQQVAISNNCWDSPGCDAYRPTVRTLPERLWRPRQAVPVTDRAALPIGPTTGAAR